MKDLAVDTSNHRLAQIPVQASVRVCGKSLKVSEFLNWTSGTILSFDKPASARLALCLENQVIGTGRAVKVGNNFGLQLDVVVNPASLNR